MAKKKRADTQDTIAELNIKFTAETDELKRGLETVKSQLEEVQKSTKNTKSAFSGLTKGLAGLSVGYIGKQLLSVGQDAVQMAMEVEESENLFTVSLGNMAGKARKWSEEVSNSLGLNAYSLREQVGTLYNMTTSMGLAADTAYDLSTTMTGLAYDMASFYNLETEEAFTKLRSGLTGEAEPLKAIGILVDENTIKQAAYRHGVAETGEELTQQQKVIARYLAILDQTSNAQGDMARTMDSPANQVRRMKEEFNQAAIALGQSLLPVVKTVLPYVTALAQVAADALGSVSSLTGATSEMTSISSNFDVSNVSSSLEGITEDAEAAESALKGATVGLDELNVLGSNSDVDAGDTTISGSYSYDLSSSGYDLLGDLEEASDDAYGKVKGWLEGIKPLAEDIGSALLIIGGAKVVSGVKNLATGLKDTYSSFKNASTGTQNFVKGVTGAGGMFAAASSARDVMEELGDHSATTGDILSGIAGTGGGIAMAAAALGPYGGLAAMATAAIGGIIGLWQGSEQLQHDFITAELFSQPGEAISDLAEQTKLAWEEMDYFAGQQAYYREQIEATNGDIKDTKKKIEDLISKAQIASDDEFPEAVSEMKQEFGKLKSAAELSVGNTTSGVIGLLNQVKSTAEEDTAVAIEKLTTKFTQLQKLIGNELASEEAKVYAILAEASADGKLTDDKQQELKEAMQRMATLSGAGAESKESILLEEKGKQLAGISFGENVESAVSALNDYIGAFKNAEDSILESYADSVSSISAIESAFTDERLREAAKAEGYDVDAMLSETKNLAEQYKEDSLATLDTQRVQAYQNIMNSYESYIAQAIAKYQKEYGNDFFNIYKNLDPFAQGRQLAKMVEEDEELQAIVGLIEQILPLGLSANDVPTNWEDFKTQIETRNSTAENTFGLTWAEFKASKGYATGGYPEKAEVFYAREDGIPELVGRIGSRTAVANNMQITEGISDAVYRAFVNANMNNDGSTPIIIQIVDESGNVKSETYISTAERKNLRDGKVTIPIGG